MASGDYSSSPHTPTTGSADETPAQRLVRMSTGLTVSSTMSSTGSSSSQTRSARRNLYEFLVDTDHQLQLAVAQAKKATADIKQWRAARQMQLLQPGHMTWFRNHLDELLGAQLTQFESDVSIARSRLAQLVDDGVIRESTLLRPQPKKYTTAFMTEEVRQMERKLSTLQASLAAAQAAWESAFAQWIQK